jgi:hypothetical protein
VLLKVLDAYDSFLTAFVWGSYYKNRKCPLFFKKELSTEIPKDFSLTRWSLSIGVRMKEKGGYHVERFPH